MYLHFFPEWTGTLIKFLKDQLVKLQDYYYQGDQALLASSIPNMANGGTLTVPNTPNASNSSTSSSSSSSSTATASTTSAISNLETNLTSSSNVPCSSKDDMNEEQKSALKQWQYTLQLAKYMFEEGLLDRQELLLWILEVLDRMRTTPADDGILKLLLPLALQYLEEFVQSELLSRRLAYLCCKKIAHMCGNVDMSSVPQSPAAGALPLTETTNDNNAEKSEANCKDASANPQQPPAFNPLTAVFNEYLKCPHHRDILYYLSVIIQVRISIAEFLPR